MPDSDKSEVLLRQRRGLADFGDMALQSEDLDAVLTEACRLVGEALGTGRAMVLEMEDGGASLFVRAGVGWAPGVVGQAHIPLGEDSSESRPLATGEPVVIRDIPQQERFDLPGFMKTAGVMALATVPIFLPGKRPYGLLQVNATEPRDFDQGDIDLLRTCATLLGPAIDRLLKLRDPRAPEGGFRAFVTASNDVVFRMSPDWSEMRELQGRGILADLLRPGGDWRGHCIHPADREKVEAAIDRAIRLREAFELEHRVPDAEGRRVWALSRAVPITDAEGHVLEWLGAARDVTDRQEACEALRQSEGRLRSVLDGMDEAFGLLDRDFRILTFNEAALRLETSPLEEIEGHTHWDVYPGSEDGQIGRLLKGALAEQRCVSLEHLYTWRDGTARWLEMRACPVPEGLAVFWRDISERKAAEERLRASEARYRTLLESIDEGFYFAEAIFDGDGRCVDILYHDENSTAIRMTRQSFRGRRLSELGAYEPYWLDIFGHTARTGEAQRLERYAAPDDIFYDFYVFKPPEATGTEFAVIFHDVTARRRAEDALRKSATRQAFLLALGDAMRAQSSASGLIEVAARLLGEHLSASRIMFAEFDEVKGVADIFHGWFAEGAEPFPTVMRLEEYEGPILDEFRAGRTVRIDDTRDPALARPDLAAIADLGVSALLSVPLLIGGRLTVNLSVHQHAARHWTDEDVALVQEVAERLWADLVRTRAEAALRESEARLRNMLRIQTVGVMFWSEDFVLTDVNEAFLRLTGRTREDALGMTWADLTPPEFQKVSHRAMDELRSREECTPYKKQYYRKDGSRWWGLFAARRIGDEVVEFVLDITERRETEAALRESEARFRAIVETARDYAVFTADAEGRLQIWPTGAQEVFGWTAEEAQGQLMEMTYTPEDRATGVAALERQEAREKGHAPDVRWHIRKNGSRVFIDGVVRPLTDPDGTVTGFVKVGQDVTERRATEEALRESEARFQQFGEASSDVLWIRDAETLTYEYLSPAYETVYGISREEALRGNQVFRWLELVHPDERERMLGLLRRVRAGQSATETFRIIRPSDGQVRWIRNTDFPLRDRDGRVRRIGGLSHDTTEEIETRERLQVLVTELQHRTRNLIGVVLSIANQTMAHTGPTEAFREEFGHRMAALSRVQGLLSRAQEDPITLRALLKLELDALGATEGERVRIDGPFVRIRPTIVQTVALVVHELATNARKYGALSEGGGRLSVEWQLRDTDDGRRVFIDWRETDLSPTNAGQPAAERASGYGRRLIERALPYSLGAQTSYELGPTELRCTIDLPLDPATADR